jgi:hypothetical protein
MTDNRIETALMPIEEPQTSALSLNMAELKELDSAEVVPIELSCEYWTPKDVGEVKRMYFDSIRQETSVDISGSGNMVEIDVAYFVEVKNGVKHLIRQASKRLVGTLELMRIAQNTPLEITYLGKQQNKRNQNFMSDTWSVKPLVIR